MAYLARTKGSLDAMNGKPKVSVLMGIHNCAGLLPGAVDSILAQTYDNWELVLCDDGSTDETAAVAATHVDRYPGRILLVSNPKNMGLAYSLNKCLDIATGAFMARQDADDFSVPQRFQKQVDFLMANPRYGWVSSAMDVFNETGDVGIRVSIPPEPSKLDLVRGACFAHAPTMFRAEVLRAVGGYTVAPHTRRGQDYDLWMKLYAAGYVGYNLTEALYRVCEDTQAYRRKTTRYYLDEAVTRYHGYRAMRVPLHCYRYILKPVIVGLLPLSLMKRRREAIDGRAVTGG